MVGGKGPFKRELSGCVQVMLLVATAESYPARNSRTGQYSCLNRNTYKCLYKYIIPKIQ